MILSNDWNLSHTTRKFKGQFRNSVNTHNYIGAYVLTLDVAEYRAVKRYRHDTATK